MKRFGAALCVALASTSPAAAQPLICFGNEPSWRVAFSTPDRARVTVPDGAFLAGCCRIPAAPQTESAALERTSWRLVSLPGHAPATLAKLERGVTARFEAGRVTGFAGCNTFTGPYTLKENRLTIGVVAGTMMACPEPAMSLERAFHAALTGTFSYAIKGDRLSLTADSGALLAFEKEAAETLEGGTWTVTGYNNGRQAVLSPMADTQLTVAFENGTVTGTAGCNTFRATYSIKENRITVGPAATTRMMCGEDVMTQEREFLKAVESATTWTVDGGLLHLHRADGERVLVAGPRRR